MSKASATLQQADQSSIGTSQIIYENPSTWLHLVDAFLKPRLKRGFLREWKRTGFRAFYDDDTEWLAILESSLSDSLEDTESDFAEYLCDHTVRLAHGCRPSGLAGYMRLGIRPYDAESFRKVLETFLHKNPLPPIVVPFSNQYRNSRIAEMNLRSFWRLTSGACWLMPVII